MTWIRHLTLPAVLVLLGLAAAPAHATLLVRSDGAGLLVRDKNGLDDQVRISGDYTIRNENPGDIFAFEAQVGCLDGGFRRAFCTRNGPIMTIQLLAGRDRLIMEGSTAVGIANVTAGSGNDSVFGHPGKDEVNGGSGDDQLVGLNGDDTLLGSVNSDRLEGGNGNDSLLGEDGADVLIGDRGDDVLRGGSGNDFLNSREPEGTAAVDDALDCGTGFDAVETDLADSVQADCEEIDEAPVGETPNVKIPGKALGVSSTGEVDVRLRCPRGVGSLGCNGRLQLRVGGAQSSRSRTVPYRTRAGRRKTVRVQLTAGDVRTLRRNQRRGRATRGVLTSIERGRLGRKTTIRSPLLRQR